MIRLRQTFITGFTAFPLHCKEMVSVDGKTVLARHVTLTNGKGILQVDVTGFSPGIYFLKADYRTHVQIKKVVVQ